MERMNRVVGQDGGRGRRTEAGRGGAWPRGLVLAAGGGQHAANDEEPVAAGLDPAGSHTRDVATR